VHQAISLVWSEPITPTMFFSGHLVVKVISASGLPLQDSGNPDPYCNLASREDEKLAKTKFVSKSVAPLWNEEFEIDLVKYKTLEYKVRNHDLLSKHLDIAHVSLFIFGTPPPKKKTFSTKISFPLLLLKGTVVLGNLSGKREIQTIVYLSPQGSIHTLLSIPLLSRQSSRDGLFGVPIELVAQREGRDFPLIVERIIKELERRDCLGETGIYRLSGAQLQIKSLKDQLTASESFSSLVSFSVLFELMNCSPQMYPALI